MTDKNLILYLPFDDPQGSKAFDFTHYRNDATLSGGAELSKNAKRGKSLALNGGECITQQTIPFSQDFTLCLYVMPVTDKIGWMAAYRGLDNYQEQWYDVTPGRWVFMAFVHKENRLQVWMDQDVVFDDVCTNGNMTGLSLNDCTLSDSSAQVDELKVFDVAKSPREILEMQKSQDVEYYLDGHNFKEFGVEVTKSAGITGRLEQKENLSVDWDSYHGKVRDKSFIRYKERKISLDCMIAASGRSAFVEWSRRFLELFDKPGNHRLKIEYDGDTKPLEYEVVLDSEADISKTWGKFNSDLMVGTFQLKLVEDEPVKMVLRHIASEGNRTAAITVTSNKLLNVYWGDGTHTYNVSGRDVSVRHTYEEDGDHDIVITGVIEDIEQISSNCIVIWRILK